jgi:hypothetical protein
MMGLVAVACAVFLLVVGAAVAAPSAGDWDFEMLLEGQPAESPDMDEDWVAWARLGLEGSTAAVVLHNSASGETRTVAELSCSYLDLCGGRLVLRAYSSRAAAPGSSGVGCQFRIHRMSR